MRIIECDRCHKRIKGVSKTGYINLDLRDIGSGELEGNHEFDEWDLCEDCMRLIRNFIKMTPPVRHEPDRPGSNVPKQPTVPPMPKGFKADKGRLRGLGKRGYDEILAVLGRNNGKTRQSDNTGRR